MWTSFWRNTPAFSVQHMVVSSCPKKTFAPKDIQRSVSPPLLVHSSKEIKPSATCTEHLHVHSSRPNLGPSAPARCAARRRPCGAATVPPPQHGRSARRRAAASCRWGSPGCSRRRRPRAPGPRPDDRSKRPGATWGLLL